MTCRGFKHIPFKGHLCDDMSTGHLKGRIQCTEGPYFRQLSTPNINAFLVDGVYLLNYHYHTYLLSSPHIKTLSDPPFVTR